MLTEDARQNMIEQQIRPWNVFNDEILAVMQQVPREFFVPEAYHELAFADIEVPLPHHQSMMAPKIEAHMLQALNPEPGEHVLEIGTGSGYITACLAWLSGDLTSVEFHQDLATEAAKKLAAIGAQANILTMDAFQLDVSEKYDVIAVTSGLPMCTDFFENMLTQNGRLFQVVGNGPAASAELVTRIHADAFKREALFETALQPLINAPQPEKFVF